MNIKLSKLYKNSQENNDSLPSCQLLDLDIFKQKILYRKRSLSKRGSNNKEKRKSTSGLKLFKTLENSQISMKSNPIKPNYPQTIPNTQQKLTTRLMQNPQNLSQRQIAFKQQISDNKQRQRHDFHGSWGIPKYSNQSPTKITFESKPVKEAHKQKMPDFFNLKLQGMHFKYNQYNQPQLMSPSKTTNCGTVLNQSGRSKGFIQTFSSRNNSMEMRLSVKQVQKSNIITPVQSQTFLAPTTPQNYMKRGLAEMLRSTHSGLSVSTLQPIEDLQEAREVRSHYSRDLNGSKIHEKVLKQSMVIASDFNSEGFWN